MTSNDQPIQEALLIAQLVVSQTSKPSKCRTIFKKSIWWRHVKKQETPLLQYVGLKIFYTTRSRTLIDDLYYHMIKFWSWPRFSKSNCAYRTLFIIASFFLFLKKLSSVCGLKITLTLTQKQILTNQVTMGLVHLWFRFRQTMMQLKNFLQFHLQAIFLKIEKTGSFACWIFIGQRLIPSISCLCATNRVFVLHYSTYRKVPGAHYLSRKSLIRILQSKCLSQWMGWKSCITETWPRNCARYQYYSSIITR